MAAAMSHAPAVATLGAAFPSDWVRRSFVHRPDAPAWVEPVAASFAVPGTALAWLRRSREGLGGAVAALRDPAGSPGRPRVLLWRGAQRIREETFQGWFGGVVRRAATDAFRLVLRRADAFFVADPATGPTYLLPLSSFAALGVSHDLLESVLDAPVRVAADGLYAESGHVTSHRVFVDYDGRRYAHSTRKLFYNRRGDPVSVELVARELLHRFGYDVVHPAVFRRLFRLLVDRPVDAFDPRAWPRAHARTRTGPLGVALDAASRLEAARRDGVRVHLERALAVKAHRWPATAPPPAPGAVPGLGRFLSRARYESFLDVLGDARILAVLEGFLEGYEAASADWFAWRTQAPQAFLCEVKSRGDTLRPSQKASILWCQRTRILDYRLLEVLHRGPATPSRRRVSLSEPIRV